MKTQHCSRLAAALCGLMLSTILAPAQGTVTFVPLQSTWRYSDAGLALGTTFVTALYDDSAWSSSPARLGFGGDGEQTQLQTGHLTYYFRGKFTWPFPPPGEPLQVRLKRDDGAVVHLNGIEVFRSNMPTGRVTELTAALSAVSGNDETNVFLSPVLTGSILKNGTNILAVSVHQSSANSADLGFDLELIGNVPLPSSLAVQPPPHYTTIANPFLRGGNTLNEVLPFPPDGSVLAKWEFANQTYVTSTFDALAGQWTPNRTLTPGEGAWFCNPLAVATSLTLTGQPPAQPGPIMRPTQPGLRLVSTRRPVASTFEEMMGFPPLDGDRVLLYEGAYPALPTGPSRAFVFSNAVWNPSLPLIPPGQSVFVDLVPPPPCLSLTCPPSVTRDCQSITGTVVTFTVTATNRCAPGNLSVFCDRSSGGVFPVGTTWVNCVATGSGETNQCSFPVTVLNNCLPPDCVAIFCPTNISVDCAGSNGTSVPFTVTATNYCFPPDTNPVFIECSRLSGSSFLPGTTTVDCYAWSRIGPDTFQTNACNFTVTVASNCPAGTSPTLTPTFTYSNCTVQVCWSDPGSRFVLQCTTSLAPPVRWTEVPASFFGPGGERCATISNACQGTKFFRLVRTSLPVFNVTGPAVTPTQFNLLAQRLGLPPQAYDTNGFVQFTDAARFQAVPSEILGVAAKQDEEGVPLTETRLLFNQINQMQALSEATALQLMADALTQAGLSGPSAFKAEPEALHSRLKAVDAGGTPVSDVAIDTKVRHRFTLGGLPLVGPGAKVAAHFDATGGVTHVNYTLRPAQAGAEVPLVPQSVADQAAENSYQPWLQQQPGQLKLGSKLVYYAPDPEVGSVQTLLPHYEYHATFQPQGASAPITLRTVLVPAVASSNYVPRASITVSVANGLVSAQAQVTGGRAPYAYIWNSSSAVLNGTNSPSLSYVAQPRDSRETLSLLVTDANGITAAASSNLVLNGAPFAPQAGGAGFVPAGAIAAEVDVGTEWIGPDSGLDGSPANAGGFAARMRRDASVEVRFNWGEYNAWERDFKDPTLGGDDRRWVDNVDAVFYTGHAGDGGWDFYGGHDDTGLHYSEARYGEVDLEWLVVAACGPLQEGTAPTAWWQRWGPAFRGLHLLCGYDNESADNTVEGGKWARYMLAGRTVAQSWMLTGIESQWWSPLNVCVMTSYDARAVCNMNDHFWGKGTVGPDITAPTGFVLYSSPVD